jgi:hypothetical protein
MSDTVAVETPKSSEPEVKVPEDLKSPGEAPKVEVPSARSLIEDQVLDAVEPPVETPQVSPTPPDEVKPAEEPKVEAPLESKLKEKIQKRINKEVAKRKTLEEQLAEKEAEIAQLRSQTAPAQKVDGNAEPTDAQIREALIKAQRDGDVEFATDIMLYAAERKAKRERELAMKEVEETNRRQVDESKRQQVEWTMLVNDYVEHDEEGKPDLKHELSLTNQNGALYKAAMTLYQDKELRESHYNDPNKILGFRRAVSDAYRELVREGRYLTSKKEAPISSEDLKSSTQRRKTMQLAEPGSETSDVDVTPKGPVSDTDNVAQEILNRRKFQAERSRF